MKIGIFTLPLNNNFGGILQAYALRTVLENLGHDVIHIEEKRNESVVHWTEHKFFLWWNFRRRIKQAVLRNMRTRERYARIAQLRNETENIRTFVKARVPRLVVRDLRKLAKKDFHCIIVGSDQIWRPKYYSDVENSFLGYTKNWDVKRIAYAPSFGVDNWDVNGNKADRCVKLLRDFDAVSVRETEGVTVCRKKFSVEAVRTLDPTLLLDKKDYEMLIGKEVPTESGQLTTYILDNHSKKQSFVKVLLARTKGRLVEVGVQSGHGECVEMGSLRSIERWLRGFMSASFIFTDSFHGCVFAILFKKPFIVVGNPDRGLSRFISLLQIFDLSDRMVDTVENVHTIYNQPIDWNNVDKILESERKNARSFLYRSLLEEQ